MLDFNFDSLRLNNNLSKGTGLSWLNQYKAMINVSCSSAYLTLRVTPVRLEPAAARSRVKHSTTEPLRSPFQRSGYGIAVC